MSVIPATSLIITGNNEVSLLDVIIHLTVFRMITV